MWSHPQLPLATPETDQEVVLGKGKVSEGEAATAEPGNLPSPSVRTPFPPPQFPSRLLSEVSRFLNFGSVPVEVPPLVWDQREKSLSLPFLLKLYLSVDPGPQKISPLLALLLPLLLLLPLMREGKPQPT
jgi:hypothetical protein